MKKLLDLSDECVEILSIEALKKKPKKTDFKNLAQDILEREAVRLAKKNKNKQQLTAAGMTSGGLRVQNFQNTIQNERSK